MRKNGITQYKKSIAHALPSKTKLFRIVSAVFFVTIATYLYLIVAITFDIVERRSLAKDIRSVVSEISIQEGAYANVLRTVTEEKALALGFTENVRQEFAIRKADVVAQAGQ